MRFQVLSVVFFSQAEVQALMATNQSINESIYIFNVLGTNWGPTDKSSVQ